MTDTKNIDIFRKLCVPNKESSEFHINTHLIKIARGEFAGYTAVQMEVHNVSEDWKLYIRRLFRWTIVARWWHMKIRNIFIEIAKTGRMSSKTLQVEELYK